MISGSEFSYSFFGLQMHRKKLLAQFLKVYGLQPSVISWHKCDFEKNLQILSNVCRIVANLPVIHFIVSHFELKKNYSHPLANTVFYISIAQFFELVQKNLHRTVLCLNYSRFGRVMLFFGIFFYTIFFIFYQNTIVEMQFSENTMMEIQFNENTI